MQANPILGESPELQAVLRAAQLVAKADCPVLILGESGTGKEELARRLHRFSPRADGPFVAVNCGALPAELAESELFGHRRGAFTGADRDHPGFVGAAEGGTLFLDEIGDLPLPLQPKLLRFLERGERQALGESRARTANVRVLAATHRDLHDAADQGLFRRDLFYRLHVVPLELPPLRLRGSDVLLLADHFLAEFARAHDASAPRLNRAARQALRSHSWPGNVRELRHLCERLVLLLPGQLLGPENLGLRAGQAAPADRRGTPSGLVELPVEGLEFEALEHDLLRQAMERARGCKARAARLLGLSRNTLLYRLKKHAIEG
ncbi:sigma54 specific transcriptional regulator, Fis family [Thioalkalivibrio nitratireducens DSM 14787]|uniref:Sigma54 specific transcriptional regulator, Fis family n=1 Tax=Thioalkalivibrio nitratireducens (strain DSM 14787 / UNIQEM 213 / ALEN2) TaxID=1255043 RepID=L0DRH3_THIND|nr:sigma-54 dependent transcriptional regulator [Thioalkalivibrio nitratireducens]AGA32189.1 sigma54 specific transcriptional regulator, Fis family [Thioalkalivibrio nitratireducens DSM 14787]